MFEKAFILCVCLCIHGLIWVARQISVSNEVYQLLVELKGDKSFSEVIKENIVAKREKSDIMAFAGILKDEKKTLEQLSAKIAEERESNYGRPIE